MKAITQKRLKQLMVYHPETGIFTATTKRGKWPAGRVLGHVNERGYVRVRADGGIYMGHRLAWLYMTGRFPEAGIDHIDRCRSNNAWRNLRPATQAENNQNTSLYASNKSGRPGVSWHAQRGRWRAAIQVNRRSVHIGYFDDVESAAAAYEWAKALHHPFSPKIDMGGERVA